MKIGPKHSHTFPPISPHAPPSAQALRMSDAVRLTGLGRSTLYREIEAGRLRSIKIGKSRLFLISDLQDFLEGGRDER